jgi:hypothetical protein
MLTAMKACDVAGRLQTVADALNTRCFPEHKIDRNHRLGTNLTDTHVRSRDGGGLRISRRPR